MCRSPGTWFSDLRCWCWGFSPSLVEVAFALSLVRRWLFSKPNRGGLCSDPPPSADLHPLELLLGLVDAPAGSVAFLLHPDLVVARKTTPEGFLWPSFALILSGKLLFLSRDGGGWLLPSKDSSRPLRWAESSIRRFFSGRKLPVSWHESHVRLAMNEAEMSSWLGYISAEVTASYLWPQPLLNALTYSTVTKHGPLGTHGYL